MIFYSILFYLIINQTFGILEIRSYVKNECSVKLETDDGIQTCFNQKCSDYKDPWRILYTHNQDRPCYLHYLKLSFTTYDQLLIFIELQTTNNRSLAEFFDEQEPELCMLEIEIDTIYPFNKRYFLSENMLNKLGGNKRNIEILIIEIKRWYRSSRSVIQMIDNDLIHRQPFEQIMIIYKCNINHTLERLLLAKYLKYQERSTCPTQIHILPHVDYLKSGYEKINLQNEFFTMNSSLNSSHFIHYKIKKPRRWGLITKILIVLILIISIVVFLIYRFIYSRFQSTQS